ncbi:helix-turn-helix domain-containing protein [Mesorhizobium sp. M0984]|uniref:helix-turn-helix domain-containing protein n=1 Tax=Mesorhizobium sp. M0984 TaxID=2957041 RepID=UPI00333B43EA
MVAEYWSCSERSVRNLINAGKLGAFRVGKLLRVRAEDVQKYERMNTEPSWDETR